VRTEQLRNPRTKKAGALEVFAGPSLSES